MINGSKLLIFFADPGISESKIFFGQGAESAKSAASQLAGQPAEGPAFSRPYHHQYGSWG